MNEPLVDRHRALWAAASAWPRSACCEIDVHQLHEHDFGWDGSPPQPYKRPFSGSSSPWPVCDAYPTLVKQHSRGGSGRGPGTQLIFLTAVQPREPAPMTLLAERLFRVGAAPRRCRRQPFSPNFVPESASCSTPTAH
jgi:hypothetical protein